MSGSADVIFFETASFRDGVDCTCEDGTASFTYGEQSFSVDFSPDSAPYVGELCKLLANGGLEGRSFQARFEDFSDHALQILEALDRFGYLTERDPLPPGRVITGTQLWHRVRRFAENVARELGPVFLTRMRDGEVDRGHLIQYARQYYYVVAHGPRIIGSSLAHSLTMDVHHLLEEFLRSELRHDRLILKSLEAVGLDRASLDGTLPLPETFALIAAMQVMADQEPLSFYSSVYLLEEANVEFHDAFRSACEATGLPEAFWTPILSHSDINDDHDHGEISADLLAHVPAVDTEAVTVVLKQVRTVLEALRRLEDAILANPYKEGQA